MLDGIQLKEKDWEEETNKLKHCSGSSRHLVPEPDENEAKQTNEITRAT